MANLANFSFWPAIDKDTLDYPAVIQAGEAIRSRDGHKRLSAGEAALSLSHRAIYEHVLATEAPCALVFEDDVTLCESFSLLVKQLQRKLNDFDFVKLDYCKSGNYILKGAPFPWDMYTSVGLKSGPGGPCASAYIVSSRGAKLLAEANTPVWINADGLMDEAHLAHTTIAQRLPLHVFHTYPPLATQGRDDLPGGHNNVSAMFAA